VNKRDEKKPSKEENMKRIYFFIISGVVVFGLLFAYQITLAKSSVHLNLNGTRVGDEEAILSEEGRVFVSVSSFASYYKVDYNWDGNRLTLNGEKVGSDYGQPTDEGGGRLSAPIRALAESLGGRASQISWDWTAKTVSVWIPSKDSQPFVKSLVALGDSVTSGTNLGSDNSKPSTLAFPSLMGNALNYEVTNLGEPGWRSDTLKQALLSTKYDEALKHAGVVTIEIGGNDILFMDEINEILSSDDPVVTPVQQVAFEKVIQQFGGNLQIILKTVKAKAPNAKIVLSSVFNTMSPQDKRKYDIVDHLVSLQNEVVDKVMKDAPVMVVDVNRIFKDGSAELVITGDLHPSAKGHAAIANAMLEAIRKDASK
jgi:lysophospholipase L1-like esterase